VIVEDQSEVLAFLADPASHGTAGPVERIDTHISAVFLAGQRAYKLKRAVRLPYADFSTLALRRRYCEREAELDAAWAPGLCLGVRAIERGADGRLGWGDGSGDVVDWVVAMRRFPPEALLDRVAASGGLTPALVETLAARIAQAHEAAPVVREPGAANLAAVLSVNEAGFATSHVLPEAEVAAVEAAFREGLERRADLLDARAEAGRVRRCHGDLHLRNVVLWDGQPRLFDGIDFNDRLATCDVLYDLAFLLMDLWHRGLRDAANRLANRYCDRTGEDGGWGLLPYLMALRAAVRAHVGGTRAEEMPAGAAREEAVAEARSYLALAASLLARARPRLVALGGLSGSGKTTVAEAAAPRLAPPPGARILESDRLRKAMLGREAEERLPAAAYAGEVSDRVYAEIARRAEAVLEGGGSALAEAVHDRPDRRAAIEAVAARRGAPFAGFWLAAPPDLLRARVAARRGGPSDATLAVLEAQLARDPGPMGWRALDAAEETEVLARTVAGA
jgi:aminoglycoside phosphotransferase family enzyme/predicted kinase